MVLTARGHELIGPVRDVLNQIQTSIAESPEFKPEETERLITIMTSDYTTEVLLSEAFIHFKKIAPNVKFRVLTLSDYVNVIEQLERGTCDMVITLSELCSDRHPNVKLFSDDFVVLCDKDHPRIGDSIDLETYSELGHVVTEYGMMRLPVFEGMVIKQNKIQRNVEVSTTNFMSVPLLIRGTERIASMHRRLARRLTQWLPLKTVEVPFEVPNLSISAIWHHSAENDPCMKWLARELVDIASKKQEPQNKNVLLQGDELEAYVAASKSSRA
jgi:DNA-binding transcriptional LysR family regulator